MKNTKAAKESIITRAEKYSIKLTNIASIKPGYQWSTNRIAPQGPGMITSATRTFWYNNESRELNVADIKECIDGAFRILHDIADVSKADDLDVEDRKKYDTIIMDIKSGLLNASDGISNLTVTYHDDDGISKRLRELSKSIKERYLEMEVPVVDV